MSVLNKFYGTPALKSNDYYTRMDAMMKSNPISDAVEEKTSIPSSVPSVGSSVSMPSYNALSNPNFWLSLGMKGKTIASSLGSSALTYGSQGGIGTGIGELAAGAGGFAAAIGVPLAAYSAARIALPAISKAIFGEGTHVWEVPTEQLLKEYTLWHRDKAGEFKGLDPDAYSNLGMSGWGGNPIAYQELLRRGVSGLPDPNPDWKDWNVYFNENYGGGWA